ncbi:hypothetical protein RIF29_04026 [Crotalaria pallida]|uniref:Uncharacterized protein n=1 Tax=Crotalaria pallida TaxID=3830 RepID=A0AAN9J328_CROPI
MAPPFNPTPPSMNHSHFGTVQICSHLKQQHAPAPSFCPSAWPPPGRDCCSLSLPWPQFCSNLPPQLKRVRSSTRHDPSRQQKAKSTDALLCSATSSLSHT